MKSVSTCLCAQPLSRVQLFVTPGLYPQGSSIHGSFQARILEYVAIFFPQGIFLTQRSNWCLLHWQGDSLPRSHLGSPCPLAEMIANCLHLCPLPTPRTFLTDKSVVAIVLFSGCHALPTTPGPQWHLWVKPIAFQGCPRCHWPIYTKGLSKSDDWPSVKYHPLCSWNLRVSSVYTLSWSYLAPSSYCVKGPQVLLNKPC